jgi:putative aminopeptidase FrvX
MALNGELANGELALNILAALGGNPAVAFHEGSVASKIRSILAGSGLSAETDLFGNIIARLPGKNGGQDPRETPIALVAHMDHPGFEAVEAQGVLLVADALGGIPDGAFQQGVPVQVILSDGRRLRGSVAGRHGEPERRRALIQLDEPQAMVFPRPVVFDLTDYQMDGEIIRMRAVDDLAGCASILAALITLAQGEGAPGDVYGVFTRAEEVGLVGARLMAEEKVLPLETLVVSAESSRTLPGAEQGQGPVIRVGDAGSTFDSEAEACLVKARETLQARPEGFKVQRQLMSGGVCEASAFAIHGYRTTGIAFPLGNYHNGGAEGKVEAEFIHRDDFIGGVELMIEAARKVGQREQTRFRQRMGPVPPEFRERLAKFGGEGS